MYNIIFYEDKDGYSDVTEYIKDLAEKRDSSKNARILFNKIVAYMNILCKVGTRVGEPVTKHLDGEIWELRPLKNRFLYAYYQNNEFIILHYFVKKTKKTPKGELEVAKKRLQEFKERDD